MRRNDVVLVADRAGGDYAGKPRPAVIVQAEEFAEIGAVVVCLLTTPDTGAPMLRVPLRTGDETGLRRPSRIAVEKLTNIRRERVGKVIGRISDEEAAELNRSLALFLGFG